jgi:hypothetical protein
MNDFDILDDLLAEIGKYQKALDAQTRSQAEVTRIRESGRFKHMQTACRTLSNKSQQVNVAEKKLLEFIRSL